MVDVNISTDVKALGVPQVPTIAREDRDKPQVAPVADAGGLADTAMDDKVLHGRPLKKPVSGEEVKKALDMIKKRLAKMSTKISLSLSEDPKAVVVQVRDSESGEIIRQFPSEEVLELRAKLDELVGMLFDTTA